MSLLQRCHLQHLKCVAAGPCPLPSARSSIVRSQFSPSNRDTGGGDSRRQLGIRASGTGPSSHRPLRSAERAVNGRSVVADEHDPGGPEGTDLS